MTFTRSQIPIHYNYYINHDILNCVYEKYNLGVIFEPNLFFNKYYLGIIHKSSLILGFITRNCSDFTDPSVLKTLFIP